jgi:hypothetical protein
MCSPVTSDGRPYSQFQRALRTGNPEIALAAARELRSLDLADALSLVLLLRSDAERYPRGAVRWLERYCRSCEDVSLRDSRLALDAFIELAEHRSGPGAARLAERLRAQGQERAAQRLEQAG